MYTCTVIDQVAKILFIMAMLSLLGVSAQFYLTLNKAKEFMSDFKNFTENGVKLGFYNFLAKILGARR